MATGTLGRDELAPRTRAFYRESMETLQREGVPFLVGGAYAFAHYTGIPRHTKDFDIFVRPRDARRVLDLLDGPGRTTELTFPHWLGKVYNGEEFVDVIFSSGNGIAEVDDEWFAHADVGEVFGLPVRLCPPEEMIWSKSFIMERERFDGADVAHILHARAETLDWERLLRRIGPHWRILLTHLVLFGYVYPGERHRIPAHVLNGLLDRCRDEARNPDPDGRLCRGTILSRSQYLTDVYEWDYQDARLAPHGPMSAEDVSTWTAAIADDPSAAAANSLPIGLVPSQG